MKTKTSVFLLLITCILLFSPKAMAEDITQTFSITLDDAQKAAEKNSNALQSAQYILQAAKAQSSWASSYLFPRADLNGNYFYQTHVTTQNSGASSVKMGDNENYSISPIISYTLFDGGKTINSAKSARLNAEAKKQDLLSQKRDLTYSVSLTYSRVQMCVTNLVLTRDALKLSQDQSTDIDLRFKVGTASKLDQVSAHKEMLNYKLLFQQAQNDLSSALQDLFALIGESTAYNTGRPLPSSITSKLPTDIAPPTIIITIDPLENTLTTLSQGIDELLPPGEESPQIKSLSLGAKSSEKAAQSQRGANWPKINLSAESRTGYPDSINRETYNNNIFSIGVSLPLWDWKQNKNLSDKYMNEAKAKEKQTAQKLTDMKRDDSKTSDTIASLDLQRQISQEVSQESEDIARLTYQSYTAGKSTYLEVQNANIKFMQDRVNTAKIEYNLINKISEKIYLSGNKDR